MCLVKLIIKCKVISFSRRRLLFCTVHATHSAFCSSECAANKNEDKKRRNDKCRSQSISYSSVTNEMSQCNSHFLVEAVSRVSLSSVSACGSSGAAVIQYTRVAGEWWERKYNLHVNTYFSMYPPDVLYSLQLFCTGRVIVCELLLTTTYLPYSLTVGRASVTRRVLFVW